MSHRTRQHGDSTELGPRPRDTVIEPTEPTPTIASELADVEREVAELVEVHDELSLRVGEMLGGDESPADLATAAAAHVVFVPAPGGYALHERPGPPPARGDVVVLEDGEARRAFVVAKLARSPLPDDPRACCYLLPAHATAPTHPT